MLLVTLEQTFTPAERSLKRMGEHKQLRDMLLYTEIKKFCASVERHPGRRVKAFISGIDTEADVATESS